MLLSRPLLHSFHRTPMILPMASRLPQFGFYNIRNCFLRASSRASLKLLVGQRGRLG